MFSRSVRDALVASVACVLPPVARQMRKLSTVPNASSSFGKHARVLDIVEQPRDLRRGKIGIEQESRTFRDHALEALLFELGAQRRGATILPDDGVVDRLARPPIPDQRSFTLVGDAEPNEL